MAEAWPKEDADGELTVETISQRFHAPSILIFGSINILIGFVFVTGIGLAEFLTLRGNEGLRLEYPSGWGYWPASVSELVHDQQSPAGRIFHTFGVMAAACIFLSWYPLHLRNVYTGDAQVPIFGPYGPHYTTLRQVLPAMGIWQMVGINTYPTPVAMMSDGHTKVACMVLHFMGGTMMFVGYLACELKCLGIKQLGFSVRKGLQVIQGRERVVRLVLAQVILIFFAAFGVIQALLILLNGHLCCADRWAMTGENVTVGGRVAVLSEPQVVDTASGGFLLLKVLCFTCEVVAGLALVFSHIAVWYFCKERFVDHGALCLKDVRVNGADS